MIEKFSSLSGKHFHKYGSSKKVCKDFPIIALDVNEYYFFNQVCTAVHWNTIRAHKKDTAMPHIITRI